MRFFQLDFFLENYWRISTSAFHSPFPSNFKSFCQVIRYSDEPVIISNLTFSLADFNIFSLFCILNFFNYKHGEFLFWSCLFWLFKVPLSLGFFYDLKKNSLCLCCGSLCVLIIQRFCLFMVFQSSPIFSYFYFLLLFFLVNLSLIFTKSFCSSTLSSVPDIAF